MGEFAPSIDGTDINQGQFSVGSLVLGQEYILLHSILADGGNHFGVSALSFDLQEELLWMGNQGGHVTSYYSCDLQKYTSFQVDATNEIKQLATVNAGILALTSASIRLSQRRGLTVFNHSSEQLQDLQCMMVTPSETLLMGGNQPHLVELNLARGEEMRTVDVGEQGCIILRRHPRFVCVGDIGGKVTLRDPTTLKIEHTLESHTGMLADFDVHGNQLVTCGLSSRHGTLAVDPFLMVYDLRMMRAVAPIQVMFPPCLLRFVPAFTSRLCVVSQSGQFQLVDTGSSTQPSLYIHQVETGGAILLTFDTAASGQALAFGDAVGNINLFGASNQVTFNPFSQPTEFADPVEPLHPIDINDDLTPLSTIPMPYCTGKLLSDWPKELIKPVYRRTPPIDPQIINSMKMVRSIGYAPNPGNRVRNQVPYPPDRRGRRYRETPRESPLPNGEEETVPQRYQKIEIKYSKMGFDDFDFNLFNRTCFSGLEANLPNAYSNNMIQVLYFVEPLRCALLNHLCHREFCLSCELGFLFNMLDKAQGFPCQPSNFLRAFRTLPEASALGLILPDSDEARKKANFPRLVQSWIRFVLQQIHSETQQLNPVENQSETTEKLPENEHSSIVNNVFGANIAICNRCRCGSEKEQDTNTLLFTLVYPDLYLSGNGQEKSPILHSFSDVVEHSLSLEQTVTAWCDKCVIYQPTLQTKKLKTLPSVLVLSCGLDHASGANFWKIQIELLNEKEGKNIPGKVPEVPLSARKPCRYGNNCTRSGCKFFHEKDKTKSVEDSDISRNCTSWLPLELKIKLELDGKVKVKEGDSKDGVSKQEQDNNTEEEGYELYQLMAVVSVVQDPTEPGVKDNIISCVKVSPTHHVRHQGSACSQWYLFNDFTILPITQQEAVFLNLDWKLPCVLLYSQTNFESRHSVEVQSPIAVDVFEEDIQLAAKGLHLHFPFKPLAHDELPFAGMLVAMDAEFVTLNQEEAEIRSDGTRSTIRPSQLSVARISCVRGEGPQEGVPFIDDYISTQEQVVDYMTKFSGIEPGDLDASVSNKHLTTLKDTYIKLRFLIDTGVKFVGHGLKNDFRVINLVVPPGQVRDTALLFQLPNKRMISLRFLAWHFLGIKIQSETHDSIEDSKTALWLYRKYTELEKEDRVHEALKELYEAGRDLQWKVPGTDDT